MYLQYKQPFPWKKIYAKWIKHAILLENSIHMITRNLSIEIMNPVHVLASVDGYILFSGSLTNVSVIFSFCSDHQKFKTVMALIKRNIILVATSIK